LLVYVSVRRYIHAELHYQSTFKIIMIIIRTMHAGLPIFCTSIDRYYIPSCTRINASSKLSPQARGNCGCSLHSRSAAYASSKISLQLNPFTLVTYYMTRHLVTIRVSQLLPPFTRACLRMYYAPVMQQMPRRTRPGLPKCLENKTFGIPG
jgi:hypothetical protein